MLTLVALLKLMSMFNLVFVYEVILYEYVKSFNLESLPGIIYNSKEGKKASNNFWFIFGTIINEVNWMKTFPVCDMKYINASG